MIPVPHITAATPHMLYNDPIQNNYPQIQTKLIPFPPV